MVDYANSGSLKSSVAYDEMKLPGNGQPVREPKTGILDSLEHQGRLLLEMHQSINQLKDRLDPILERLGPDTAKHDGNRAETNSPNKLVIDRLSDLNHVIGLLTVEITIINKRIQL